MSNYQRYPNEREVRPYGDEEADFSSETGREFDRDTFANRSGRYRGRERYRQQREGRGAWEREGRGMRGEYGTWEREGRERQLEGRGRGWEGYGTRERDDFGGYEDWRDSETRYGREGRGSRGFAGGYETQNEYGSPGYRTSGSYGSERGYGGREYEGERGWNRSAGASASDMRGFEGNSGREGWGSSYNERYGTRGYESGPLHRDEHQFGSRGFESAGFGAGPEGIYGMQRGYESGQGSWGQSTGSSYGTQSYAGVGPRGYQRSDERVREDVCDRLERDARIDASNIEVEVQNGMVTLKGNVDDRRFKRQAEEAIEHLAGVKDVQNQIRVEKRQSFGRVSESKENRPGDGGTTGREGKERKSTTTL